jgi:hypothetical protein
MTHLTAVPDTVRPAVSGRSVLATAAGCSLVAAATHLYVVPEHAEEWPAAAVFFVVLAVLQLGLAAVLLRRPGPRLLEPAAHATVGLVVFYVLTRTVDLPLLPPLGAHGASHLPVAWGIGNGVPVFPGEGVEEVGTPDLVCLGAELATVVLLAGLLPPAARRRVVNVAVAAALVLVALRVAGVPG